MLSLNCQSGSRERVRISQTSHLKQSVVKKEEHTTNRGVPHFSISQSDQLFLFNLGPIIISGVLCCQITFVARVMT